VVNVIGNLLENNGLILAKSSLRGDEFGWIWFGWMLTDGRLPISCEELRSHHDAQKYFCLHVWRHKAPDLLLLATYPDRRYHD